MNAEHDTDAPREDPSETTEATAPTEMPEPELVDAYLVDLGLSDEVVDATPSETREAMYRIGCERRDSDEARMRALADFRNFQRRSIENESRARREGTADLVRVLLPALDHFDLALQAADGAATVDQVVSGVRMVREEILRAFESLGIHEINAATGEDFQPGSHEALGMLPPGQFEGDGAPGTVATTVSPGFAFGDFVLRPAKVMLIADPKS
ncbi:MAG: nucleotide exchange factor GrpE [Planctomycetota bacterium]|nr:nucleotide exchange factor GrpE [Planctomycetota bacterium]